MTKGIGNLLKVKSYLTLSDLGMKSLQFTTVHLLFKNVIELHVEIKFFPATKKKDKQTVYYAQLTHIMQGS